MSVRLSTVLRLVDAPPEPEVPAPLVVGVNTYATRKGRYYGTALVDVETRRPVDLLPDREASSLAACLPSGQASRTGRLLAGAGENRSETQRARERLGRSGEKKQRKRR
ncbi:hypothetical protein ACIBBE_29735 [Streptomyces sp. NPDC051644]|uniref:hypothetical protein n=1 Tax=Streptomyces sp. NPDC051644 TaxID=3365666 RepID=UPI0037AC122A